MQVATKCLKDTTQLPGAGTCDPVAHTPRLLCSNNNAFNCSGAPINPPGCCIVTVHEEQLRAWGTKVWTSSGGTTLCVHQEGQR